MWVAGGISSILGESATHHKLQLYVFTVLNEHSLSETSPRNQQLLYGLNCGLSVTLYHSLTHTYTGSGLAIKGLFNIRLFQITAAEILCLPSK